MDNVASMLEVKPKVKREPDVEMGDPASDQDMGDLQLKGSSAARPKTTSNIAEKEEKAIKALEAQRKKVQKEIDKLNAMEGAGKSYIPSTRQSDRLSLRSGSSGRGRALSSKRMRALCLRQLTDIDWNHQVAPRLLPLVSK
jgi:hypothetical protein